MQSEPPLIQLEAISGESWSFESGDRSLRFKPENRVKGISIQKEWEIWGPNREWKPGEKVIQFGVAVMTSCQGS